MKYRDTFGVRIEPTRDALRRLSQEEQDRQKDRAAPAWPIEQIKKMTKPKYQHAEAFCLMHYACPCGHKEVIWNSRDGVTPFCMGCPSCGEASLSHTHFYLDRCAPDHKPHRGQRVWIGMTIERAKELAARRILHVFGTTDGKDEEIKSLAENFFHNGESPDIKVWGEQ